MNIIQQVSKFFKGEELILETELLKKLQAYEKRRLVRSNDHPTEDMVIWNYTDDVQHNPGLWDEITMMARGLITDNNGNILQRPFKKFFNYDDKFTEKFENIKHVPLDMDNISYIQDKADGSLGIMYWDANNQPCIASRGSFESVQAIEATKMIREQYDAYLSTQGGMHCRTCDIFFHCDYTHLFEIIFPENRIVVDYGKDRKLLYLGSVNKKTGEFKLFENTSIEPVVLYSKEDFDRIMLNQPKGNEMEGFVITFKDGEKLKVKFENYKKLHKIVSLLTDRDIWFHMKHGSLEEQLLSDCPIEYKGKIMRYADDLKIHFQRAEIQFYNMFEDYKNQFKHVFENKNIDKREQRKQLALGLFAFLKDKGLTEHHSSPFFAMLDNKPIDPAVWSLVKPAPGLRSFLTDNYSDFGVKE